MPKLVDYPNSSWSNALKFAEAVRELGQECSLETCASRLGMAVKGGAFNYIKAGAMKYGLVDANNGKVATTELFRQMDLAYDPAKKSALAAKAFLNPGLFLRLWEKYRGSRLPVDMLGKILAADFAVPSSISLRIASYFVDGAREVGLLGGDNTFVIALPTTNGDQVQQKSEHTPGLVETPAEPAPEVTIKTDVIVIIKGKGINFSLVIESKDDIEDVKNVLKTVERKISTDENSKR